MTQALVRQRVRGVTGSARTDGPTIRCGIATHLRERVDSEPHDLDVR
jgi:hypothetical protein